jgi:prevent-host-death family protein
MNTVAISELRNNLPDFLKKVERGEKIMITNHGKEVAMIVPVEDEKLQARQRLRELGKKAIIGDVVSPIDVEWKAMK